MKIQGKYQPTRTELNQCYPWKIQRNPNPNPTTDATAPPLLSPRTTSNACTRASWAKSSACYWGGRSRGGRTSASCGPSATCGTMLTTYWGSRSWLSTMISRGRLRLCGLSRSIIGIGRVGIVVKVLEGAGIGLGGKMEARGVFGKG